MTGINYIDTGAPAGNNLAYTVTAVNSSKVESLGSNTSLSLVSAPTAGPVPTTPVIQQADASTGTQVVLTWGAASGAASYIVMRQGPGDSTFVSIASGITATTFTDTNITQGATYTYELQAQNSTGLSGVSAPISVKIPPLPSLPAPTNLAADASSGVQAVLTWGASAGAATYLVEREDSSSNTFFTDRHCFDNYVHRHKRRSRHDV